MAGKVETSCMDIIHPMTEPRTSIGISKSTKDRLAKFGFAGESLETALIRVLEIAEKQKATPEDK